MHGQGIVIAPRVVEIAERSEFCRKKDPVSRSKGGIRFVNADPDFLSGRHSALHPMKTIDPDNGRHGLLSDDRRFDDRAFDGDALLPLSESAQFRTLPVAQIEKGAGKEKQEKMKRVLPLALSQQARIRRTTKETAGTILKAESAGRLKKLTSRPAMNANSNGTRGRRVMLG